MQWIGSPNYSNGRGGKKIELIVVHHIAGTLASADAAFQKPGGVSAHYSVGRNGEIHQYVAEGDTAYHAGNFDINQRSIGIEHEDLNADNYTDLQYQTSANLIRRICKDYGLPINSTTIRPHKDFIATACPGSLDIDRLINLANQGEDMAGTNLAHERVIAYYIEGKNGLNGRPNALNAEYDGVLTARMGREATNAIWDAYNSADCKAWTAELQTPHADNSEYVKVSDLFIKKVK